MARNLTIHAGLKRDPGRPGWRGRVGVLAALVFLTILHVPAYGQYTWTHVAGLAGISGTADGTGGAGGTARFNQPFVAGVDPLGNLLVGDSGTIRRIDGSGTVTTISGVTGVYGDSNGGTGVATYRSPTSIACAADGSLWIADASNYQIRRLAADDQVTTLAGNST